MQGKCILLLIIAMFATNLRAGDITGAPVVLPPQSLGNFSFLWSNDFLGSGGATDDYRTQQLGMQIDIKSKWGLIFDHSILTASRNNPVLPGTSGRLDQVSLSFMYDILPEYTDQQQVVELKAGAGVRSYGNFGGRRMQNSFHRLLEIEGNNYSYVGTEDNTAIIWIKGDYQELYQSRLLSNGWQAGYWLAGTMLATTAGEWDATVSANAIMQNRILKLWLGLRQDWRENYDTDFVQAATALSESGTSLAFGLAGGPIILETVQGIDDKASFGRLVLTSVENQYFSSTSNLNSKNAINVNLLLPDVELELQYRKALSYRLESLGMPRAWWILGIHYGEPAYQGRPDIHINTRQLEVGMELEWRDNETGQWVWPYLSLLAGNRTEQLRADSGNLAGEESVEVSSVTVEAAAGLRFNLYPARTWQLLFQAGLVGHYPLSAKEAAFDQTYIELLKPDLSSSLGLVVTFGF